MALARDQSACARSPLLIGELFDSDALRPALPHREHAQAEAGDVQHVARDRQPSQAVHEQAGQCIGLRGVLERRTDHLLDIVQGRQTIRFPASFGNYQDVVRLLAGIGFVLDLAGDFLEQSSRATTPHI